MFPVWSKEDKSVLFDCLMNEGGMSIVDKTPLTMECTVIDVYEIEGFESFICTIDNTYVEEHLNEFVKVNYNTLKSILFEFSHLTEYFIYRYDWEIPVF